MKMWIFIFFGRFILLNFKILKKFLSFEIIIEDCIIWMILYVIYIVIM